MRRAALLVAIWLLASCGAAPAASLSPTPSSHFPSSTMASAARVSPYPESSPDPNSPRLGLIGYYSPGGYPILVNTDRDASSWNTWKWEGNRWRLMTSGSHGPYWEGANMAYDPEVHMTLVPGSLSRSTMTTLGWNGTAWVEVPAGPTNN